MATPTTAPDPYASILNDPFYSSLLGDTGAIYSSILNDPGFNSLVSSIMGAYSLDSYYYPTATYNPYATGGGGTAPAGAATAPNGVGGDASRPDSSKSAPPIGAIVGGVVGGVVVLALIGLLVFCLRRRKRRANEMSERDFFIDDTQPVQAFPQPAYTQAPLPGWETQAMSQHTPLTKGSYDSQSPFLAPVMPTTSYPSRTSFSSSGDPTSSPSVTVTSEDEKHRLMSAKSSSLATSSTSFSPAASTLHHSHPTSSHTPSSWARDTVIEHAVDAGSIPVPPPVPRKEVLPPMYDPNWSSGPAHGR